MRNIAKRTLSLLCIISMLLSMMIVVQAAGVVIGAETKTLQQGSGTEIVKVPINISGNTGILGMTLQVTYGEGLTLTGVEKGSALSSLTFTKPGNFAANPINIVWDGESGADKSDGCIVTLTFKVPKGTAKEYPISLTTKGVFDDNLDDVVVSTINGKIAVIGDDPAVPSSGTVISVQGTTITKGEGTEIVQVPVNITGNTGILGMTLQVTYGEGLTLTGVERGSALSSLMFTKPGDFAANPINIVWDGESGADKSVGCIVILTFKVPKDTVKEYPISLTTKGVFDNNLDDVEVATKAGKITVTEKQFVTPVVNATKNSAGTLLVAGKLSDNSTAEGTTLVAVYTIDNQLLELVDITTLDQSDFSIQIENMKDAYLTKVLRWNMSKLAPMYATTNCIVTTK